MFRNEHPSNKIGAEQSLAPYETCCLATVFLPNVTSKEELMDACELTYRINKHSLMLPCHHKDTEAIVHKNMRMGISITGVMEATPEQLSWLDDAYIYLRQFDLEYSAKIGVSTSIKLTTVQPSGTLSLLPGILPGVHPGYARFMYRRIRIAADHSLVTLCRENGYPVEYVRNFDNSEDYNTVVVTFPFKYSDNAKLAKDVTAIEQLETVKMMQRLWSDNGVSCTVYYKKEELPQIKEYLAKYYKQFHKSLSFLLHSDHGFQQAPYEEVTEDEYRELLARTRPIGRVESATFESSDECAAGVCPVK